MSESVENILSEIKNVISGDNPEDAIENQGEILDEDDDIMELTEIVGDVKDNISNEGGAEKAAEQQNEIPVNEPDKELEAQQIQEDNEEFIDVLQEIDDSIKDNGSISEEKIANQDIEEIMANESTANSLDLEQVTEIKKQSEEKNEAGDKTSSDIEEEVNHDKSEQENMISEESAARTSMAVKELIETIPKPQIDSPQFRSGTSLEDVVRESISPMLKGWLDENLETVVKEIVQKEIKKILPNE